MIVIKSAAEIELIAQSGRIAARCMKLIESEIRPGITTAKLASLAHEYIEKNGGSPSFYGYRGFPGSICTSINDVVVHGIPDSTKLRAGDIIGIDLGVLLNGYHSDMARTFGVGEVSESAERLMETAKKCFFAGMSAAVTGNRVSDISKAVEKVAHSCKCGVVTALVGHGIGTELHEGPDIPNFTGKQRGNILRPGMTLCIEPMINLGTPEVIWDDDGWTVHTKDGSLSAHYENTIAVRDGVAKILTVDN